MNDESSENGVPDKSRGLIALKGENSQEGKSLDVGKKIEHL